MWFFTLWVFSIHCKCLESFCFLHNASFMGYFCFLNTEVTNFRPHENTFCLKWFMTLFHFLLISSHVIFSPCMTQSFICWLQSSFFCFSILGENAWYPVRMPHYKVPWHPSGKITHVWLDYTFMSCCTWWTVKHNRALSPLCWTRHDDRLELSPQGQHNPILGCSSMFLLWYFTFWFQIFI